MHETVAVSIPPRGLSGDLILPDGHRSIIVFAHSGASRHSLRARQTAEALAEAGFGALLVDMTIGEERHYAGLAEIDDLAAGLVDAIDWIRDQPRYRDIDIGLLGSGIGAAAALKAATLRPGDISSIVSRGGRPDLAGERLSQVKAPTLLIVGGSDDGVLKLNQQALRALGARASLSAVPGATHLFEEPGAMDAADALTIQWFCDH